MLDIYWSVHAHGQRFCFHKFEFPAVGEGSLFDTSQVKILAETHHFL